MSRHWLTEITAKKHDRKTIKKNMHNQFSVYETVHGEIFSQNFSIAPWRFSAENWYNNSLWVEMTKNQDLHPHRALNNVRWLRNRVTYYLAAKASKKNLSNCHKS